MEKYTDNDNDEYAVRTRNRLRSGLAWMICRTCGGKLWDFDDVADSDMPCPYIQKDPRDAKYKCKYDFKIGR